MNKENRLNESTVLLFTGSLIEIQSVQVRLNDHKIHSLIKDRFNSALLAGFGDPGQNQLFVYESDYLKAMDILNDYISEINLRAI